MQKLIALLFSALQYAVVVLMAPITLAVCAGLLLCTHLITRKLQRPRMRPSHSAHEWLGRPASEWLGA